MSRQIPPFCRRCGERFEEPANPAGQCSECGQPTICKACSRLHACCQPDECLSCRAPTTMGCGTCPHGKERTAEWLLNVKPARQPGT